MRSIRVRAAAKINWTLEVLGARPDGYHEVRTILQTISLCDEVALTSADELSLTVHGASRAFRRAPPEENLAFRAAALLRERAGYRGGARIDLEKRVPVAAGLGGGSSDAAAVLRGLRRLWEANISDDEIATIAAELGSDVPFFLRGGAALASGRGEILEPLPDLAQQRNLIIAHREAASPSDKTTRMYAALRPEHYTDGSATERLAARLRAGDGLGDEDIYNVFASLLPDVDPGTARALDRVTGLGIGQPHLCGSGPAIFFLERREPAGQDAPMAHVELPGYPVASFPHTLSSADVRAMWDEG
ncbi:MAG: 4-(cytidine 5'-diphospho)-2-C-methyl-D-erythritol kinase [Dehalococcoidia bacterium]